MLHPDPVPEREIGSLRGNQGKIKPFGWLESSSSGVLIKRGNLEKTFMQGECHVKMKAEMGVMHYTPRKPKIVSKTPEAGSEARSRFSFQALGRNHNCWCLDLDFQPPELSDNKFLLFESPCLWHFIPAALKNGYSLELKYFLKNQWMK